jgi:peptidoglycan/xylan/chitin deacetylase (PgdA/CDA1 family)
VSEFPLVLCYHAVSADWEHQLAVRPDDLLEQVGRLVRHGYRPVSAAEALEGRSKTLHVTFDDAFRSVSQVVPALARLGARTTVFACPGYADDGRRLEVGELAAETSAPADEVETMRWDELRELLERGVEVGSHTVSHPRLTRLSDAELEGELGRSKEQLEDELGRPCPFLAYPFGDQDARVRAAARRAGYAGAFALPGERRPLDPYAVPRVGVYRKDTRLRLALKCSAAGWRLAALRRRPRR